MKTIALLVNKKPHFTIKEIKNALPDSFKNIDYLLGFLDGYLFKEYKLISLDKLSHKINNLTFNQSDYYLIFVNVESDI